MNDHLIKHDGLLTLIRLFELQEYKIRTRVLLLHDKHTRGLTIHVSQCLHGSHIIQFKHKLILHTHSGEH